MDVVLAVIKPDVLAAVELKNPEPEIPAIVSEVPRPKYLPVATVAVPAANLFATTELVIMLPPSINVVPLGADTFVKVTKPSKFCQLKTAEIVTV